MYKLKYYFNIIFLFFTLSCELPINSIDQENYVGNIFADYDQDQEEIFISVELLGDWDFPDTEIEANMQYNYSPQYYTVCIESVELSNYLIETLIPSSGLCASPYQPVKGCMDPEAINFNEFAVSDDGSCFSIPDSNWNHIQFGEFDWQTHSVELIVNHTHTIQNFSVILSGLPIDSIQSYHDFSYPLELNENEISWQNLSNESLDPGTQKVCRIYFKPPPVNFDGDSLMLNDAGMNGDLISGNNIYHAIMQADNFVPGIYSINLPIIPDDDPFESENLYLFHNFNPQIHSIEMPDTFHLDNDFTTYLTLNINVYEPNGYGDLKQVKFMVNTSQLTNEEFPDGGEDVFQSDPSWLFQYVSTAGSNIYRYQTNIPMTAANNGGKTGLASFRFLIVDMSNAFNYDQNMIHFEHDIEIIKCGDQICDDGFEDIDSCPEDCTDG